MIKVFDTAEQLSNAAADFIIEEANKSIEKKGSFTIALSGGSTPKRAFEILAQPENTLRIDWSNVHVFWGDERCVPFDHPDSNAGMTFKALLDIVDIPQNQIHKIEGGLAPEVAASSYDTLLRRYFKENQPSFDLSLQGLGTDGHTASLFPFTPVLEDKTNWAKEVYLKELHKYRITLTQTIINNSSKILFLVAGENKADALNEIVYGASNFHKYPAQLIKPVFGELVWFIDKGANKIIGDKALMQSN